MNYTITITIKFKQLITHRPLLNHYSETSYSTSIRNGQRSNWDIFSLDSHHLNVRR